MLRIFPQYDNITAAFSDKGEGNLSVKWGSGNIQNNREKFLESLGLKSENLVLMQQPHGKETKLIKEKTPVVQGVDAILTQEHGLVIGVETADCLPLLAYEPFSKTVGVAHAGWRGIESGVVENFIQKFPAPYDSLAVFIGPHIHDCCFEVKSDVADKFAKYPKAIKLSYGKFYISLEEIVKQKLIESGVREFNIQSSPLCTACSDRFFSYRRDSENIQGAMLGIISLNV